MNNQNIQNKIKKQTVKLFNLYDKSSNIYRKLDTMSYSPYDETWKKTDGVEFMRLKGLYDSTASHIEKVHNKIASLENLLK